MPKRYLVVGGEYADSSFSELSGGRPPEEHGPFTEKEAMDFWRAITGRTVDNALVRYKIRPIDDGSEPHFFVIGGEYADTAFTHIVGGKQEYRHGPFTRQEALDFWRAITSKTVDSAMTRYHIVEE